MLKEQYIIYTEISDILHSRTTELSDILHSRTNNVLRKNVAQHIYFL